MPCQDRTALCALPPDLAHDDSLQAQIELCYKSLSEAKEGKEVQTNLLKAWCHPYLLSSCQSLPWFPFIVCLADCNTVYFRMPMHAHMSQAQAILRKSIRDTTAEEEDPDKQYKDESESDSAKPARARGRDEDEAEGGEENRKTQTMQKKHLRLLKPKNSTHLLRCPPTSSRKI